MHILKALLVILLFSSCIGLVFITPAYPPTAYQFQYYSVVFRIRGADYPIYKFSGLPQGIVGTSDGKISGIPVESGSYSVRLSYMFGNQTGFKDFIIIVTPDNSIKSTDSVVALKNTKGILITFPDTYVFTVGEKISLKFGAKFGTQPYIWSYSNLPGGIIGNENTGQIEGFIRIPGYYNIDIQVADKNGKSASAYITLNIHPTASKQSSKQLVNLLSQTANKQIDASYVEFALSDSGQDLAKAQRTVLEKNETVKVQKKKVDRMNETFERSNNTYFISENDYLTQNINKKTVQLILSQSQSMIDEARKKLNLAFTEANSSIQRVKEAQVSVNAANKRVLQSQKNIQNLQTLYETSSKRYKFLENQLKIKNQSRDDCIQNYNKTINFLEQNKGRLETAKKNKQMIDIKRSNTKDNLDLVLTVRDNAEIQVKKMDFELNKKMNQMNSLLGNLTYIRQNYVIAKDEYQTVKLNYELKLSVLYLAQARKETADRTTSIALAEGSLSDHNSGYDFKSMSSWFLQKDKSSNASSQTITFLGCQTQAYPPIKGTAQIQQVKSNRVYILSSGHFAVYGECSKVEAFKQADWVQFSGYVVKGTVHALRIEKVSLNQKID